MYKGHGCGARHDGECGEHTTLDLRSARWLEVACLPPGGDDNMIEHNFFFFYLYTALSFHNLFFPDKLKLALDALMH